MTDLPVWLQEIRDRADKATPGPWTAEDANPHKPHKRFAFYIPAIMSAPSMPQYDGLTEEDAAFIAHSRTDVPRLIGLVGEMGEAIRDAAEVLQEHVEGESVLIERLWRLWKKYRWEEENA